ncbi:hypothetical protein MPTK1_5g19300 [Marchantia polymorpha subsp. ruderalis]|uniref:Uncharacterized protein n=2 Tax=Marchantia polymorpha TaxID=3197 RepID=A0AAF6BK09_MARPO|nr:hypothetical protein MARPO_0073s0014 [Marchantia polymorpha]BBN12343.1 hypothetical protein Mp_5g19300 [Marchantia polymorpha subsp. ruderalis]|eukprot:PTQ35134.1 hypothetical protein MARPO_0073s0014 [Marchantia polymorpha]
METLFVTKPVIGFSSHSDFRCVHYDGIKLSSGRIAGRVEVSRSTGVEVKATGRKSGGIGSGRRRRGMNRKDTMQAETDTTLPFLEPHIRVHKEEGHQVLVDVEYLLLRAPNPFGLVLEISEEANEFLRNNKEDSLQRKPVLKMISDRINEAAGEQLTDSYIEDQPDNEKYEL